MGSRKRIYNAAFREGAVRIVTETGKPIPEVAEEPGSTETHESRYGQRPDTRTAP